MVAAALGSHLECGGVEPGIRLGHCETGLVLARNQGRQHAALLRVGAEHHDRLQAEDIDVHGGSARHGGAGFGDRLHHDGRLGDAEARAAIGFRHGDAEPSRLRQRSVQLMRKIAGAVLREPIGVVELRAELEDLVPDLLLLLVQRKVHDGFRCVGSVRSCVYARLRWAKAPDGSGEWRRHHPTDYSTDATGDTTFSIAAAMASRRRSAPWAPNSMRPTGASPAQWHGSDIAQPSTKFVIAGLRSTSALVRR